MELKKELKEELTESITRSLAAEIARIAQVIDEHHRREIGVVHDKVQSVEDALKAHKADTAVHLQAS